MAQELTATAVAAAEGLDDWRYTLGRIDATFTASTPAAAAAFAAAAVASTPDRAPDVDLRGAVVRLSLPPGGPLTEGDLTVARALSTLALGTGLTSAPLATVRSEIAIDALDLPAIKAFWKAAFAYEDDGPDAVADPLRIGPAVWFQQMDAVRPERNHIHIDVTVPHDVADQRVAEVLAAGGRHLYSRDRAFHVLADPEGNEVCICTWLDRD